MRNMNNVAESMLFETDLICDLECRSNMARSLQHRRCIIYVCGTRLFISGMIIEWKKFGRQIFLSKERNVVATYS